VTEVCNMSHQRQMSLDIFERLVWPTTVIVIDLSWCYWIRLFISFQWYQWCRHQSFDVSPRSFLFLSLSLFFFFFLL
jgi:hypothetical protein